MNITLATAADTRALGEALATLLRAGDVLALNGSLGAGKTTLVQGLAWGLGLDRTQYAPSPTYAIALTYPTRPLLNHLDLYRLERDAAVLLGNDYFSAEAITVVEWPERAPQWLPAVHFALTLERRDDDSRLVTFGAADATLAERICVWRTKC